jgi:hypothetical protein
MSSNWAPPGAGAGGEYQKSGIPYVTSSAGAECKSTGNVVQISFPRVTRWFEITTSGSSAVTSHLRVGFTNMGVQGKGSMTGSIQTGEFFQAGNNTSNPQQPKYVDISPAPAAWKQSLDKGTHAGSKNYFVIPASSATTGIGAKSHRFEIMCTDLFLMSDAGNTGFTIIAGLTNIQRNQLSITGSAGFDGVG